ncbi:hypothetical protein [Methylacidimicrobium tartarophylax]|uniref:Uncharacterized protein n=1 Tax=Methylacidimicrobium tartarophylax TaxID=1041768 RepID=A0A5E6M6Z8_9BACT|nr:hypothetical protein [Methylacidimicrobium tartarophylax]VVM05319.1 hypothetical protein MAMT_00579 [Methylacidimicrobium tartarophylax]
MSAFRILAPAKLFSPWLLDALRASLGSEISVEAYAREEESRNLVASGSFDLAALPDTTLFSLCRANLLLPLASALSAPLPAEPQFLHHYFDPANQYAWPFGFTLLAIGGQGAAAEVPSHWKELADGRIPFRPPSSPLFSRFLFAALAHGFPPLPGSLGGQAAPAATPQGENARIEVDFVQQLEARGAGPGWIVRIPAEGSWIRLFHWVIPRGCANPKLAGTALPEMFRPSNLGRYASEALLAVTTREARQAVPTALLHNPNVYPAESLLDRSVFARVDWLPSSPAAG